jgi:hypothetical protein
MCHSSLIPTYIMVTIKNNCKFSAWELGECANISTLGQILIQWMRGVGVEKEKLYCEEKTTFWEKERDEH